MHLLMRGMSVAPAKKEPVCMRSLLEIIHEYQSLRGRSVLGVPLDDTEQACLVGLARLLRGEVRDGYGRREMPRVLCPLPVQLTLTDGFSEGRIRNISGSGMAIRLGRWVEPGTRLLIHVLDPVGHVEYVFPSRAVRCDMGTLGVAFDGVPLRTAIQPPGSDRPRRVPVSPLVA
jgi:hypothetical protein